MGRLIYFFPVLYLFRFSTLLKKSLDSQNPLELDIAFRNLSAHCRYIGILAIIGLVFYGFGSISSTYRFILQLA